MTFEKMIEPFEVGVSFKAISNPPTESKLTIKVPETSNPEAIFITVTSKINNSKEGAPLNMATVPFPPVKFGISTFKYQGHQNLPN